MSAKDMLLSSETSSGEEALTDAGLWFNGRASAQASRAAKARAASPRRRNVDPATCERNYSAAELEFMNAMHSYKQASGRNFPTWSEVLEVLHSLGYRKLSGTRTSSKGDAQAATA